MFFGNAERVDLDSQGRVVIPQKLRTGVGIGRDVIVIGVSDRLEISERRRLGSLRGIAGRRLHEWLTGPRGIRSENEMGKPTSLLREFGQSLYLIGLMAGVLCAYLGLGLLAVRFLG